MAPKKTITVDGNVYALVVTPVATVPEVEVKPKYFTRKEIEAGLGHVCVLGCGKRTRSLDRSLRHAANNAELKLFGHDEII